MQSEGVKALIRPVSFRIQYCVNDAMMMSVARDPLSGHLNQSAALTGD